VRIRCCETHIACICLQAATAAPAQSRAGGTTNIAARRAAGSRRRSPSASGERAAARQSVPATPNRAKAVSRRQPFADVSNIRAASQVCPSWESYPVLVVVSLKLEATV